MTQYSPTMMNIPPGWRRVGPEEPLNKGDKTWYNGSWVDIPPSYEGKTLGSSWLRYVPIRFKGIGSGRFFNRKKYRDLMAPWESAW